MKKHILHRIPGASGLYRRAGTETENITAKFMVKGKPRALLLPTNNARQAAAIRDRCIKALKLNPDADLNVILSGNGAEAAAAVAVAAIIACSTVGELIKKYLEEISTIKTKKANAHRLRAMLRDMGIDDPDAEPLSTLTGDFVSLWIARTKSKAAKEKNLLLRERLLRSAASTLRQARSVVMVDLFPTYRAHGLKIPESLRTFHDGKIDAPAKHYELPPAKVLRAIVDGLPELAKAEPLTYAGVLLGLGTGMRNSEAAALRWDWLAEDEEEGKRRVFFHLQTTSEFQTKTKKSRYVRVPLKVLAELEKLRAPDDDEHKSAHQFVIPANSYTERYETLTRNVASWLRGKGLDAVRYSKGYYELRKLYGSLVAHASRSTFRAAEALGNSPATMERFYFASLAGPRPIDVPLLHGSHVETSAPKGSEA